VTLKQQAENMLKATLRQILHVMNDEGYVPTEYVLQEMSKIPGNEQIKVLAKQNEGKPEAFFATVVLRIVLISFALFMFF
jgi:hypothetical protein